MESKLESRADSGPVKFIISLLQIKTFCLASTIRDAFPAAAAATKWSDIRMTLYSDLKVAGRYTANAYRQTTDKLMFKSVISTVR